MPEYSFYCEGCSNKWSLVSSISDYTPKQKCPECKKKKTVFRNFAEDEVYSAIALSLSEVKTLGHYADKQTKQYGKWKCEDLAAEFKTKKDEPTESLPDGMSRMERPTETTQWTKDEPVKKKRKANRKGKK